MVDKKYHLIKFWHNLKADIDSASPKLAYFYAREIWWASLGVNIGHEEDGKNKRFERPVLILKKFNQHLILVIPLSSKIKPNKFYYYQLSFKDQRRSALICQLRLISSKRLIRKLDSVDITVFNDIKHKIRNFFN